MEKLKVIYYVDEGGFEPTKAYRSDAGFDIRTPEFLIVEPHKSVFVDSKLRVYIPEGYVGMLKSKSGLNCKDGIVTEGVIDAGYTDTIGVKIYNHSDYTKTFDIGDKITQLCIMPIPIVEMMRVSSMPKINSERQGNGFGSSGK